MKSRIKIGSQELTKKELKERIKYLKKLRKKEKIINPYREANIKKYSSLLLIN